RGTGYPGFVLTGNKRKNGSNLQTVSDPNLLTQTSKANGGPQHPTSMAGHEVSSCDDLNNQSLTMSLAVVELQRLDDPDEDVTQATSAGDTTAWYPTTNDSMSQLELGDLESALILHPLTHNAQDVTTPPTTAVVSEASVANPFLGGSSGTQQAPSASNQELHEDIGSDFGIGDLPPPSSILYHTVDSCEGSPLLSGTPKLAESTF
ncbi:hypothetical protein SK128_018274, partial [Halocaridina rubra]